MFRVVAWLRDRHNRFWFTPLLTVVAAAVVCALVWAVDSWTEPDVFPTVSAGALDGLLAIIASSMLAVTTFSLAIVVSATASVASGATPRATEFVMGDDGTRRAIGSFVYAVVAKTALSFDHYGPDGQFMLTVVTLAVLGYLVARLVLWVRTVSTLGRLGNTLKLLEREARRGLRELVDRPCLGARPAADQPTRGDAVYSAAAGYLTRVDLAGL